MDPRARDDLAAAFGYAVILTIVMMVFLSVAQAGRLDAIASRLRRPGRPDDTTEARMMIQVQREISMMEHGYAD